MTAFLKKYRITLLGVVIGALGGYIYYHFYGCSSGCAIKSSPVNMTIWGTIMGGLLFSMFQTDNKKK